MAIESTYRNVLTEDFIKEKLQQGETINSIDVSAEIEDLLSSLDLTVPQFNAETYLVNRLDSSSSTKNNNTFLGMRQDLRVLYKDMINLTKISIEAFERWGLEAFSIEKQLIDLEERIDNLLILTQDTEGYHSIIIDNFTDITKSDLSVSTAEVDVECAQVGMTPGDAGITRIFLNDLDPIKDVTFKVRTTIDFISRIDQTGSSISDPFKQESRTWWTSISMRKAKPVTSEMTVKLTDTGTISLSRIFLELHDSAESSPVVITPLYSADNINFNQLPTNTFSLEARSSAVFSFSEVQAKYVKFLLTKKGPDPSGGQDFLTYQFGFKNIRFFQQGFDQDTVQYFVSKPLSILGFDGEAVTFERLTLETCERVETGTSIKYYITTSNDPTVPLGSSENINENATWTPISPINRAVRPHPIVLDVGEINETTIGDTEGTGLDDEVVTISYDGRADPDTDSDFINPKKTFQLLSKTTTGIANDPIVATDIRYSFVNSNDRILNYQIKDTDYTGSGTGTALDIDESALVIFRNIGFKGLDANEAVNQVRDVQRGWKFDDPFYSCVIEIQNPDGLEIDVGDQEIIIDNVKYTNKIENTVLTGKTDIDTGVHRIQVHKKNWKHVDAGLTTLADVVAADPLYPYNHKLLIEGYAYDSGFTEEKIYTGADIFAENVMIRVSPFDVFHNIGTNDYTRYALEKDAPTTHTSGNNPTRVFLLKIDENNPDFQNERFMIRFNQVNLCQRYLRLRADLSTSNEKITPAFDGYKIKLG